MKKEEGKKRKKGRTAEIGGVLEKSPVLYMGVYNDASREYNAMGKRTG
jgi:hypothetical protein